MGAARAGPAVTAISHDHVRLRKGIKRPLHGFAVERKIGDHEHRAFRADMWNRLTNRPSFPTMRPDAMHADMSMRLGIALDLRRGVVSATVVDDQKLMVGTEPTTRACQARR